MHLPSGYPLISCLCVTENRVPFLSKAVSLFFGQSYPNKELLIVFPSDDLDTSRFLETCDHPVIPVPFENHPPLSLGAKRNMAIAKSGGKYFCVWDDDDWHHPERLMVQFNALLNSKAKSSVLSRIFLYDQVTGKSYLSGKRQAWEGTLLCEKAVISSSLMYADLEKAEDSALLAALLKHNLEAAIDTPELYIYIYHGHNTWHRQHWEKNIVGWGTALPDDLPNVIEHIVQGETTLFASSLLSDLRMKLL